MTTYQYCTPEWLEESARIYRSDPEAKKKFKKLTAKMCYRVKADHSWGIDKDIIFGSFFDQGELTRLEFFTEEKAKAEAEYIMAATPQIWKKILRKEHKFLTDFMLGKIKLEMGSKVDVLGVAPYANNVVDSITQFDIQFPDEMSPDELERYRTKMEAFRKETGV